MKQHFLFNIPAEHLENGSTNTYITIKATQVFDRTLIEIKDMPLYLVASFKNPLKLMAIIEGVVKEKIEAHEEKVKRISA